MADLIDRVALLDAMPKNDMLLSFDVRRTILAQPTVGEEPVRHGRWVLVGADKRGRGGVFQCMACRSCYPYKCKYCPECGAKMDAVESTEEICSVNGAPCNECIPGAPCARMDAKEEP